MKVSSSVGVHGKEIDFVFKSLQKIEQRLIIFLDCDVKQGLFAVIEIFLIYISSILDKDFSYFDIF